MTKRIVLDAGPLGRLTHPRANREMADWFAGQLADGAEVIVAEIADYEVRRELIRAELANSLRRLDELKSLLTYAPLDTPVMLRAAELWAKARNMGKPTADDKALDGDVILAAQAERAKAVVATENVAHLSVFVEATDWRDIGPREAG